MTLPIEPLLAISTAHVDQVTLENITEYVVAYPNEYGAFIYVPPPPYREDCPADLAEILAFARKHNITWIKLDGGASEIDQLPTYEWVYG